MALAVLSIDLVAKLASFEQGLDRATRLAEKNAAQIERAYSNIGKGLAGLGIAAGVTSQINAVKAAIDKLDNFDDLSEKYGIAANKLSAYSYASEVAGTSTEAFASGLGKLSKNLTAAAGGSTQQLAAFKAIGVEVKDAAGNLRAADEVLLDIADRFASYEDGASKAALAQEFFGKSGADLIPILNKGRDGISGLATEAARFGLLVGNEAAKAAGDFNDNLKRIELSVKGVYQQIAVDLLPTLVNLTNQFIEGRKAYGSFLRAIFDIGLETDPFKSLKENIADVVKRLDGQQSTLADMEARAARIANGTGTVGDRFNDIGGDTQRARLKDNINLLSQRLTYLQRMQQLETRTSSEAIFGAPGGTQRGAAPIVNTKAATEAETASDRAKKATDDLIAKLRGKIDVTQIEIATGERASEADQLRTDTMKELGKEGIAYTAQQRAAIETTLAEAVSRIRANAAQREAIKLTSESTRALAQQVSTYEDANRALQDQLQEVGKTSAQVEALRLARLDDAIATREQRLAVMELFGATGEQIAQEQLLIDKMREGRQVRGALVDANKALAADPLAGAKRGIDDYLKSVSQAGAASQQAVSGALRTLEDDLTNSLVTGTFSIRNFVSTAIAEFTRLSVIRPLMSSLSNFAAPFLSSLIGGALGGAFSGGAGAISGGSGLKVKLTALGDAFGTRAVQPFATGGVFSAPTAFRFANGGAMSLGVMGEAGPEAVMPLKRGRNGKLGVVADRPAPAARPIVINVYPPEGSNGDDFRRSSRQVAADIGRSIRRAGVPA